MRSVLFMQDSECWLSLLRSRPLLVALRHPHVGGALTQHLFSHSRRSLGTPASPTPPSGQSQIRLLELSQGQGSVVQSASIRRFGLSCCVPAVSVEGTQILPPHLPLPPLPMGGRRFFFMFLLCVLILLYFKSVTWYPPPSQD